MTMDLWSRCDGEFSGSGEGSQSKIIALLLLLKTHAPQLFNVILPDQGEI